MKPIRVLHVHEVEREAFYFNNLVDFVNPNEVEFLFVTFAPEGDFTESMKRRNIKTYSLNALNKKNFPQAACELWRILKTETPDIIHTHGFNPTVLGLNLAKLQKTKTVLTRHHSDALHLLTSKIKRQFYLFLDRRNNYLSDYIIAPSKMVFECLVEWEKTPAEKVSIIPYGQSLERFDKVTPEIILQIRNELGMNNQMSLVCVSRLYIRKGHQYLFEALAPLIKGGLSAKLYLVGAGEYREHLLSIADELGILNHIEFLGWRSDVLAIIGSADIIIHPSLEDALSQSLIESLMLRRPIIATDISGASDTLDGGKYGKLVKSANSEDLRAALIETIENLELAYKKAEKGRDYLLKYMSAGSVAAKYVKIYQNLMFGNSPDLPN